MASRFCQLMILSKPITNLSSMATPLFSILSWRLVNCPLNGLFSNLVVSNVTRSFSRPHAENGALLSAGKAADFDFFSQCTWTRLANTVTALQFCCRSEQSTDLNKTETSSNATLLGNNLGREWRRIVPDIRASSTRSNATSLTSVRWSFAYLFHSINRKSFPTFSGLTDRARSRSVNCS